MNTKLSIVIVAAVLVAGFQHSSFAQESGIVAVLDVKRVFDENSNFDAQMDAIKAEADQLKAEIQNQQTEIQNDAQAVLQYEVGTDERNRKETELEQRQAALRTRARQLEIDLLTREAKIYYQTYQQMKQVVGSLAQEHGISLVLRFDSSPINPENRGEVIKGVNRTVVFHDHLDLTDLVVEKMGVSTAAAGGMRNN